MADFKTAFKKVLHHEGGYVNHPDDKGGETIFGVARNSWGDLSMWNDLDNYKKSIDFENTREKRKELESLCKGNIQFMECLEAFYKKEFWGKIKGDEIESQKVAEIFFDWAVNSGTARAIKKVQSLLKVNADGAFGAQSLQAINAEGEAFCNAIYNERCAFYNGIIAKNPKQEVFRAGWFARLNSYKLT